MDYICPGGDLGGCLWCDGEGSVSALLTAFLMRVMSSTIGCKLFSFPRISCADGCSRVFLARVITLLRKASRDWDGSLARLVLSSSNSAVASAMIWVACSGWLRGWIPSTGQTAPLTITSGYWAIARGLVNRLVQV